MEVETLRNYLHRQLAKAQKGVDLRKSEKYTLYYLATDIIELEIALMELNNLISFMEVNKEELEKSINS